MGRRVGAYIELIEPARDTQRHARRVQHFEQPQETNEAGARPCAAFTNDEVLRFDDVGLSRDTGWRAHTGCRDTNLLPPWLD